MATEKKITSRIQQKHDVAANWAKATNFIPKKGEIIIYDAEYNTNGEETQAVRFKIGDGSKTVNNLPFVVIDYSSDIETLEQEVANNSNEISKIKDGPTQVASAKISESAFLLLNSLKIIGRSVVGAGDNVDEYNGRLPIIIRFDEDSFIKSVNSVGSSVIELRNTGVKSGTYNNVTVDSKGRVTAGESKDYLTSHQSIKSINTNNTAAQTVNASEAIAGSGTINLHKIAKTGSYNDLSNKPPIPAAANNGTLTIQKNGTKVQTFTANQSSSVTANITVPTKASDVNALSLDGGTIKKSKTIKMDASANSDGANLKWGTVSSKNPYIGYASDQSDGTFIVSSLLGTDHASGLAIGGSSGNLLWKGTKVATTSDIPKVNNGTLTIQKNGTTVATFSANQSGNSTANITVPTKTSELTNNSGFLTSHQTIYDLIFRNALGSDYVTFSANESGTTVVPIDVETINETTEEYSLAIGGVTTGAQAQGKYCVALGSNAKARYDNTVKIGYGMTSNIESVTQINTGSYTSTGRALYLGAGRKGFTYMNAAGSSWTSASDIRDKTDIKEIDHALDFIKKLKPITYVMNDRERYLIRDENDNPILDSNGKQQYDIEAHKRGDKKKHRRFAGLSAQDTYQAMLDCYNNDTNYAQIVDNNKFDHPDDEYLEQYSMSYERLVPFLIKAIQEQQEQIEKLKSKLGE